MSTAVAYIRHHASEPLFGEDVQRAAISKWAAKKQITIVAWFVDQLAPDTKLDARPQLQAAIDALPGHPWLLVARYDRFHPDMLAATLVDQIVQRKGAKVGVVYPTGSQRPRT